MPFSKLENNKPKLNYWTTRQFYDNLKCRFFKIRENYKPNECSINSIQEKSKSDWYLQIYSKIEFAIYYI